MSAGGPYWFVHHCLPRCSDRSFCPRNAPRCTPRSRPRWKPRGNPDEMSVERVVDLADHRRRAGRPRQACRWTLLAADAAGRGWRRAEMLRLLRRALDLWPQVQTRACPGWTCCSAFAARPSGPENRKKSWPPSTTCSLSEPDWSPCSPPAASPPMRLRLQTRRASHHCRRRLEGCTALCGLAGRRRAQR